MSKIFGRLTSVIFRFLFASLISINYVYFVYYVWLPISSHNSFGWLVVFFFNFLFIMTIWSIVVTITGDPGSVPLYWGFHIGDSESKRKRYCLVCNVFKPERTHHCSVCNRCVLNMDHHCPWINRCIGFYNRKYFLQMLLYLNLTIIFIVLVNFKMTSGLIIQVIENKIHISGLYSSLIYIFIYIADVLILFVLVNFFKYHIQIALENKTTLENLDHNSQPFVSQVKLDSVYIVQLRSYGKLASSDGEE